MSNVDAERKAIKNQLIIQKLNGLSDLLVDNIVDGGFYGKLEVIYKGGRVVNVMKTESLDMK